MRGDVDDVLALETPCVAQVSLLTVVVVVDVEEELAREVVEAPAGKGAGTFADILLAVVADAHREALHQLPGKVLVRVQPLRSVPVSSQMSIAGSFATAWVRTSKGPAPRVRKIWFWLYIKSA